MVKYRYTDIFSDVYNQAAKVATNDYGFDFSKVASDKNKKAGSSYFDNMDDFTSIEITDPNSGLDAGKYEKKNGQIYKDGELLNFDLDQRKNQNANNIYAGFNLGTDLVGGILNQRKKRANYMDALNMQKMAQDDYDYTPAPYNPYGYNSSLQNNKTLYAESGMEFDPSYNQEEEESFTNSIHSDETETQEDYDFEQMMREYEKELESFGREEDDLNFIDDLYSDQHTGYKSTSDDIYDLEGSSSSASAGASPYSQMSFSSLGTKQGVDISKLHPNAKQFIDVLASNFPGLKISSGHEGSDGDGVHMKHSRHYEGKAIDIGANSSDKKQYAAFKELVGMSAQELKSKFGIKSIIDEGDHIHVEWV